MVLLLETAAVLEARARRAGRSQGGVLLRRADQRRQEAARLRQELVERGAALPSPPAGRPHLRPALEPIRPLDPAGP
jgi:hypothetical protein